MKLKTVALSLLPLIFTIFLVACGEKVEQPAPNDENPEQPAPDDEDPEQPAPNDENHAPVASGVVINGSVKAGKTLTLEYIFSDEDDDIEDNSIIIWRTSSIELQRGSNRSLIMPAGYEGETLDASIIPVDEKGLRGEEQTASNNSLKILTAYEEKITLPQYDENNSEMMLIESAADWLNINTPAIRYFFVKPGDYSTVDHIELTTSGTEQAKRYILLYNGNNKHAGKLERHQLAKVGLILQGADHWVIDRMSYWDSPSTFKPILVKDSSNNIFNRLYFHDVGHGLYIHPGSHNNAVQNSRFERDDISIYHDRASIGLYNDRQNTALIKNTVIVNNEMRNSVDGVQTIRLNADTTPDNDFQGTIIDNNHFYIDSTIYTDCLGTHDTNGSCAYAENALDLKVGSANPENPIIVSNNKMWGFRKADKTSSQLSDPGAVMPVHYGVNHTVIKNNLSFDSTLGFTIDDPRYGFAIKNSSIENNIFQNIKGPAIYISDTQQLTIKNNLFKEIGIGQDYWHWIVATKSTNLKFNNNLAVSTNNKSARLKDDNVNFTASNNQYFNSIYTQFADTANNTDIVPGTDPTANYNDIVFTTDRYTSNPKTITVPGVIKSVQ